MSSSTARDTHPTPLLQRQGDRFFARNSPLYALLGLHRAATGLEAFVLEFTEAGGAAVGESEKGATENTSVFVYFVLGLIRVSRDLRAVTEDWAAEAKAEPAAQPAAPIALAGLLR